MADLNVFEDKFLAEGVLKIKHPADVTVEELLLGIALCSIFTIYMLKTNINCKHIYC